MVQNNHATEPCGRLRPRVDERLERRLQLRRRRRRTGRGDLGDLGAALGERG